MKFKGALTGDVHDGVDASKKETRLFHYSSRVKVLALAQLTSSARNLLLVIRAHTCLYMHSHRYLFTIVQGISS